MYIMNFETKIFWMSIFKYPPETIFISHYYCFHWFSLAEHKMWKYFSFLNFFIYSYTEKSTINILLDARNFTVRPGVETRKEDTKHDDFKKNVKITIFFFRNLITKQGFEIYLIWKRSTKTHKYWNVYSLFYI